MFEVVFLVVLGFVWILIATIQDVRTREIANWLSFSLVIFALGFRLFYSLFQGNGFDFFWQGLIGYGIFWILGNLLYYGRVFAGGDAKLMQSLGVILPLSSEFFVNIKVFIMFFVLFLLAGAVYGLAFSFYLSITNSKNFRKEFIKQFKSNRNKIWYALPVAIFFLIVSLYEGFFLHLSIIVFVLPYLYLYSKAVDEASMVKKVKAKDLTEGDWLYKDIKVHGKKIKADWGGLTRNDLKLLRRTNKRVLIRHGIPFTPAFLLGFIVLVGMYFLRPEFF